MEQERARAERHLRRELRLYALGHYLRTTPAEQIDYARTMAALDQIRRDQEEDICQR
jgi:hypothetical protein